MLRLYDYSASCNCFKVRLLLAQLGVEYERLPVDIFAGETLTDEYAPINPARMVPVLEVEAGRFLTESAAILTYLAEGTPFLPADRLERAEVVRWLIYEQTDVIPGVAGLRFRLQTRRLAPDDPRTQKRRDLGHEVLKLLDDHLAGREFFVGTGYTIADVAVYGYVHKAEEAELSLEPHPNVRSWLARVADQPGYMNDVEPYPANSMLGESRSIYG